MGFTKKIIEKQVRRLLLSGVIAFSLFCCPTQSNAELQDVVDTVATKDIYVAPGDLVALKVYSLTRIAISTPGIVEIINADVDEVLLVGRGEGETPIFIWDEYGKRKIIVRVFSQDLDIIVVRLKRLLEAAKIEGVSFEKNDLEGKVVLTGSIIKEKVSDLKELVTGFNDNIILLVKEEGDLIQIDVQISELNTSLSRELGFNWTAGGTTGITFAYQETLPPLDGSIGDFFKIGDFNRTNALLATVSALIREGKGRILSKPSIVVANGEEASFLVGGEIPIRTTTTSSGGSSVQENISFKEYGVDLTITPEILNGRIDISLNVEIRDIDSANAVGSDVAFSTRTAETRVVLNDGQTMVLAGLIKHNESEQIDRVPFLGAIPVVGALFRKKSMPSAQTEQEVVISLTPRIFRQKSFDAAAKAAEMEAAAEIEAQKEASFLSEEPIAQGNEEASEEELELVEKESAPEAGEELLEDVPTIIEQESSGSTSQATQKSLDIEEQMLVAVESDAFLLQKNGIDVSDNPEEQQKVTVEEQKTEADLSSGAAVEGNLGKKADIASREEAQTEQSLFLEKEEESLVVATSSHEETTGDNAVAVPEAEEILAKDESYATELFEIEENISQTIAGYVQNIQEKIAQTISFPYEANEKGWEGTVTLSLTILSDGSLNEVAIKKSSGYKLFDKDAINTTQVLAPFSPFPVDLDLEELMITIPIIYSKESVFEEIG